VSHIVRQGPGRAHSWPEPERVRVTSCTRGRIGLTVGRDWDGRHTARVTRRPWLVVCICMTYLAEPLQDTAEPAAPAQRTRIWPILALGPLAGAALGVAARAWMRLISDDPEFSWSGTIFIIGGFTLFGIGQSIATATRRRARRRWTLTIARVVGAVTMMPLFVAAGSVMMPTVVGGGLGWTRTNWNRIVRCVCLAVALLPVLFVTKDLIGSFGWSLHALAGVIGMLAIYGTIIAAAKATFAPQLDGWHLRRWIRNTILVVLSLPVLMLVAGNIFT
jgi:hypothetical protein